MLLQFPRSAKALEITTGIRLTADEVRDVGSRMTTIERMFGVREGIGRKDDNLPKRFTEAALKEGPSKGSVVDLDLMLDEYYTERNWSIDTGHPKPEELSRLGLDFAISDLP